MPLHAIGWTSEEDEKLINLVEPHTHLYVWLNPPSKKNILIREKTWQDIAKELLKPVEECRKRWRCLRNSYTRSRRLGMAIHKSKLAIYEKLHFLDNMPMDDNFVLDGCEPKEEILGIGSEIGQVQESIEQQVVTDSQEYYEHDYEIPLVNVTQTQSDVKPQVIKILPKPFKLGESNSIGQPPRKIGRRNAGRKKAVPIPRNMAPIKILPKPSVPTYEPRIIKCVDDKQIPEDRSQIIDKLIEKVLKENTNEIDVFFRSMAASVKKLQPNLIPKVKMEVCNVIAKYEMQSFDKNVH